ncbi:CorA family divalent cation transporter [Vibrio astriarenae]
MEDFMISRWSFADSVPSPLDNDTLQSQCWYHCHRDHPQAKPWLEQQNIHPAAIEAILADDTRPRFQRFGRDCFVIILRGINLSSGAEPDDMLSLRMVWHKGALISTRKITSKAIAHIISQLEQGRGPESLSELLLAIITGVHAIIDDFIHPIEKLLDQLDFQQGHDVKEVQSLHPKLLKLKRYLKPQKYVLEDLLASDLEDLKLQQAYLRNCLDTVIRINESIDFYLDQFNVYLLNISQQQAEKMNRNTYLFSMIAGIFLPAGFFTGLLGVNVGGIPGTESPIAFSLFCIGLLVIIALEVLLLIKLRFI